MRACPRCRSAYVSEIEFCGIDGARIVETDVDPLLGELVDRYQVEELIGRGAMGAVYRARHTVLDRDFAMKVLFGDLASNPMFAGRFRREAQALSKLRHTNIISVNDFGTTENGLTFLVMDYVQGVTLADVIRTEGPLSAFRVARITRQIAAALAEAHRAGFIHRDVKPENIFLVTEGDEEVVKLLDFGIVAVEETTAMTNTKLTGTGRIVGTPTYMAPEQARQGATTPSVDLYALGVIMFEMLAGRPPFEGSVAELLVRHALEQPPRLEGRAGLEDLVDRLLSKSPAQRPENAGAIIMELDGLVLDWSGVSNVTPLEAAVPLARSMSTPAFRLPSSPASRTPSSGVRHRSTSSLGSASTPSGHVASSQPPRTVELGGPPVVVTGPLAEDLDVPAPGSTDLPNVHRHDARAADDGHALAAPDETPPYDPFLQPDPYYSNLIDDQYDGLLPKSVLSGSGFSQDLSPAWVDGVPSLLSSQGFAPSPPSSSAPPYEVQRSLMPTPVEGQLVARDLPLVTTPSGGQRYMLRQTPAQPTPDLMAPSLSTSPMMSAQNLFVAQPPPRGWQRFGPWLVVISLILSLVALGAALMLPHAADEHPERSAPERP
ncbi:serine/threonine protein kinase [Myxococcota bacterium]|nr:serine/threonine protein kinase [Myxococcota bacterium]